jgi:hypothetical protein
MRSVAERTAPASERVRRVEAAVRLEWQDAVQKRVGRRRATWIAASCLVSAALIALVLHAHVRPLAPHSTGLSSRAPRPAAGSASSHENAVYFRASNANRLTDRGLPRLVLARYTWDAR